SFPTRRSSDLRLSRSKLLIQSAAMGTKIARDFLENQAAPKSAIPPMGVKLCGCGNILLRAASKIIPIKTPVCSLIFFEFIRIKVYKMVFDCGKNKTLHPRYSNRIFYARIFGGRNVDKNFIQANVHVL